jgi:hypothetical protein
MRRIPINKRVSNSCPNPGGSDSLPLLWQKWFWTSPVDMLVHNDGAFSDENYFIALKRSEADLEMSPASPEAIARLNISFSLSLAIRSYSDRHSPSCALSHHRVFEDVDF